jgi:hypothetical protein
LREIGIANTYQTVARNFGVSTYVSLDKDPKYFELGVPPKGMTGIICFKSPLQAVASRLRREEATVEEALTQWHEFYARIHHKWAPLFCDKVAYINYDHLVLNPQKVMGSLCQQLGLPKPRIPDDLRRIEHHAVGGNLQAHVNKQVWPDKRWRGELSEEQIKQIAEYMPTSQLFRAMMKKTPRADS